MPAEMINAYVSGTGSDFPAQVVTNDDLREKYGIETTHDWIVQRSGIEARRFAEEGVEGVQLAERAARQAIEQAGLQPSDIDLIIYATLSPRHAFPGDGVRLGHQLGLKGTPALDVRNQCSGFVYSMATAASMVKSGFHKHVLVVGAELHSAALDLTTRGRQVGCLFGDGAGAVVVSATDEDRGIRWWTLGADGEFADELCQKVWDTRERPYIPADEHGNGHPTAASIWPYMNGKVVFRNAVEKMIGCIMGMTWEAKIDAKDIDLFFFHQANLRINQYVIEQLGIPEDKAPSNIQRYGNTTAATIPTLLAECARDGRLKPGMKVALVAFGSGFTWGATLIDW